MSVLRSLARGRAKKRMKAIGMRRVCKKGIKSKGYLWEYYKEV